MVYRRQSDVSWFREALPRARSESADATARVVDRRDSM